MNNNNPMGSQIFIRFDLMFPTNGSCQTLTLRCVLVFKLLGKTTLLDQCHRREKIHYHLSWGQPPITAIGYDWDLL